MNEGADQAAFSELFPARPVIILVRPQLAENIGMAARAMGNFGLDRMRLVAPRDGWPQKKKLKKGAVQAASGASQILAAAQSFETVEAAIADLTRVYATTARPRDMVKPVMVPDEAIAGLVAAAGRGEPTGILFGPERTGLANEEVALADAILTFPVNPAFSSLNLAQSVLLVAYEWFKAAHGNRPAFDVQEPSPPARRETLLSFFEYLEGALDAASHWGQPEKRPIMVRNLRNVFLRQQLSEQDVRTVRGAVRALLRRAETEARGRSGEERQDLHQDVHRAVKDEPSGHVVDGGGGRAKRRSKPDPRRDAALTQGVSPKDEDT